MGREMSGMTTPMRLRSMRGMWDAARCREEGMRGYEGWQWVWTV
jgi:hypothetical protein